MQHDRYIPASPKDLICEYSTVQPVLCKETLLDPERIMLMQPHRSLYRYCALLFSPRIVPH